MRRFVRLAALSSAAAIGIACGRDKSPTRTASAAPDLRLANTPNRAVRLNPDELTESSKQLTLAPRRVSATPRAPVSAPAPALAADPQINGPLPGLDTMMSGARAALRVTIVAKAAPLAPIGLPGVPAAGLNYNRGGFTLTPGGVPAGVVIRGGSVGDDHCDPHPRGGLFGGILGGIGMGSGRQMP